MASAGVVEETPVPWLAPTQTMRKVRLANMPGKLPCRAPRISVFVDSFQVIGMVA